jgi:hypothetical protein
VKIFVDIPENFQNFGENKFDNEGKFWAKKDRRSGLYDYVAQTG